MPKVLVDWYAKLLIAGLFALSTFFSGVTAAHQLGEECLGLAVRSLWRCSTGTAWPYGVGVLVAVCRCWPKLVPKVRPALSYVGNRAQRTARLTAGERSARLLRRPKLEAGGGQGRRGCANTHGAHGGATLRCVCVGRCSSSGSGTAGDAVGVSQINKKSP